MNRRDVLGSILATGTSVFAGCSGGSDGDNGSESDGEANPTDISPVTVSAEDYTRENPINTITIRYASDTLTELNPPDWPATPPDSGQKFVILHTEVLVEREIGGEIDMYGTPISLEAEGVVYQSRSIPNLPELTQTVRPEATYEAWAQSEVPEDVTEATLIAVDVEAWFDRPTQILFEPDESLSTTLPEGST